MRYHVRGEKERYEQKTEDRDRENETERHIHTERERERKRLVVGEARGGENCQRDRKRNR